MSQLIFKQMNLVMKDIKSVAKDQKNIAQGFKFRGIDQFVNALYPALTKHCVFMTTEVLHQAEVLKEVTRSNGKAGVDKHVSIQMKYTFHAEDGSNVSSSVPAEGLDSGDKATNKALSAALKYALIQTFSIPTEDMAEADLDSPEIGVSQRPKAHLEAKSAAIDVTNQAVQLVNLGNTLAANVALAANLALTKISETPKSRTTFRKSTPVNAGPTTTTTPDAVMVTKLNF